MQALDPAFGSHLLGGDVLCWGSQAQHMVGKRNYLGVNHGSAARI